MKLIHCFPDYEDFPAVFCAWVLLSFLGRMFAGQRPLVVRRSLRIGAAAFLLHGVALVEDWQPASAAELMGIAIRAMFTGGFAIALAQIALATLSSLVAWWQTTIAEPWRRTIADQQRAAERRRAAQAADHARRQAEIAWQRGAPERELARQAANEAELLRQAEQQRRQATRLECQLTYQLHAAEIAERYPRAEFDQFVREYLRDDLSAATVAQHGARLLELIRQHVEKQQPSFPFPTLTALATWHEEQLRQIELVSDALLQRHLRVLLAERYAELTQRYFEEMRS